MPVLLEKLWSSIGFWGTLLLILPLVLVDVRCNPPWAVGHPCNRWKGYRARGGSARGCASRCVVTSHGEVEAGNGSNLWGPCRSHPENIAGMAHVGMFIKPFLAENVELTHAEARDFKQLLLVRSVSTTVWYNYILVQYNFLWFTLIFGGDAFSASPHFSAAC